MMLTVCPPCKAMSKYRSEQVWQQQCAIRHDFQREMRKLPESANPGNSLKFAAADDAGGMATVIGPCTHISLSLQQTSRSYPVRGLASRMLTSFEDPAQQC